MRNIILLSSIFLVLGCGNSEKEEIVSPAGDSPQILELNETQLKSFTISLTEMEDKVISSTLRLNGIVDVPPQNLVSVSAALGGYLKSTKLLAGMHFNKGEVLAVLEDNQYIQLQQDYLTTRAQLEKADAEYQRQKELNESKASSDKILQQAKAEFESLKIARRALEEKLRLININPDRVNVDNISRTVNVYAPFDGYVTKVFVNTGRYIAPTDVMFELVDPRDLHLHLKIFEKDLPKVNNGQALVAYTNSATDKKYNGKIIMIGKNLSEEHSVEAHAHFERHDDKLIPGLYMNAEIDVPDNKAPALPEECVLSFEGGNFVFKSLGQNRFEMVSVQVGTSGNGWIEIKNPEKLEGQKIVREGAYTMLMALKNEIDD